MSHKDNSQLLICLEELKKVFNELAERIKSLENEINQASQEAQSSADDDPPGEGGNNPEGVPDIP